MKKPVLKFNILTINQSEENLAMFIGNGEDNFTANNIKNYFNVNNDNLSKNPIIEIKRIVNDFYDEDKLLETLNRAKNLWSNIECNVLEILSSIFETKYENTQEYGLNISINPVCPRFLEDHSFDIWVNMTNDEIISNIIHELLHFYWFDYWDNKFFKLKSDQKEFPSTEWVFSELAIDSLITQTKLNKFVHNSQPAYDYFYNISFNNENIINKLRNIFQNNSLYEFMLKGYEYINQQELLKQLIK